MAKLIYPLVSVAQSFTDTQKAQVRANIGAAETSTLTSETNNRLNATYSAPIHITTAAGVQAFSHDASGVSAGQYGSYTAQAPVFNGTFHVPAFTVDSLGHVTYASSVEVSIPPLPVVSQTQDGIQTSADKIKLDAINPSFYVKGNSIYGGTLTDNLNNLARTTPFTCYGTATGAPNSSYSWFGWHINSNTGTTAAKQIAWAYNSSIAICYERVKTSSSWGAWTRSGSPAVINSTATDYTFLASDANSCHLINTSASTTRTVPSDSTAPNILIGDSIEVVNVGTGTVTFAAASGVTLLSSLTLVMYGQYSVCMLRKIAANTWILTGERTAV